MPGSDKGSKLNRFRQVSEQPTSLPLIRRFGGFHPEYEPDSYSVGIDPLRSYPSFTRWARLNSAIDWLISAQGNTRRTLGLRLWGVNGMLGIRGGTVSSVSVAVTVEGENGWLMTEWLYSSEIPAEEIKLWNQGERTSYLAHTGRTFIWVLKPVRVSSATLVRVPLQRSCRPAVPLISTA